MARKWIFGKHDWKTIDRGQESCYLNTNGLGGYSSMTMLGSAARNDHSLAMACIHSPNCRYNIVHRMFEKLNIGDRKYVLSSQQFKDAHEENGSRYLSAFFYEYHPVWVFDLPGVQIRKEIVTVRGENTFLFEYSICNRTNESLAFETVPFYQFLPKGAPYKQLPPVEINGTGTQACTLISDGLTVFLETNGTIQEIEEREEEYYYAYDEPDGRDCYGKAKAYHKIVLKADPGERRVLRFIFSMKKKEAEIGRAEQLIADERRYVDRLEEQSGFMNETALLLTKSADCYISTRESTKGDTILAGFPFFEDWGRDTMISLPGLCLSTKRFELAKSILRTFASYEHKGLMPNLFPEGGQKPRYNTVDATLLFINCVWLYFETTEDEDFLREMYPVMERIISYYKNGTDYGIYMDADGLIAAGKESDQVTWMDVRIDDYLPTPRHGKPVEINAYWYNALCIMEKGAQLLKKDVLLSEVYGHMAELVKHSFLNQFWMEKKQCLKDLVSGTKADEQIRCNQIWALSMPFTMLDHEKEQMVLDTVYEKLYTPYGLRTLDPSDEQFHLFYRGAQQQRDRAYHQGTVWVYPLGAYYLAYLKVHGYSQSARREVYAQLELLEGTLREGCIGQLPEIFDGANPVSSRGCFAQAWSVGEILRVYQVLEEQPDMTDNGR